MNKRTIKLLLLTICLLGSTMFLGRIAKAGYEIQLDELSIASTEESRKNRQVLTNMPIELYGPVEEKTFFYEVRSDIAPAGNEIVLHLKHSELLIEPSAVTISIDEENVRSIPLNSETLTNRIVIPLTGDALAKGFHSVKVTFNGVIKEGVCVDQETPGNWLTIGIDSSLQLNEQTSESPSLSEYPALFTEQEGQQVTIVLPDNASLQTRGAGAAIGAYLKGKSVGANGIKILRESKIGTITGNFIVIGTPSEFTSQTMKSLFAKGEVEVQKEGLSLSRHRVANKGGTVESLIITAQSPDQIGSRISILLQDRYSKQLVGQKMTITSIPENVSESGTITLKKFGIGNLTFDQSTSKSDTYFGYAPPRMDANPAMELRLRRSDTLKYTSQEIESSLVGEAVEMVIYVNDVPYPIDVRSLGEEDNGIYSVHVPIQEGSIKANRLISLRFEVNGLKRKNPCLSNNENRWVYLSEDSYFTFQDGESMNEETLASYPYPFSDPSEQTQIVLPAGKKVGDDELMTLFGSLTAFGGVPAVELVDGDRFDGKKASHNHLIFIGGPSFHPSLREVEKDLLVGMEKGIPTFESFGFLQEAVKQYSWMQGNPWSDKKYSMIIFSGVGENMSLVDGHFLESLSNLEEPSTVAIQTKEQHLYTNATQFQEVKDAVKSVKAEENVDVLTKWWLIGFASILLLAVVVYVIMKRKARKNNLEL